MAIVITDLAELERIYRFLSRLKTNFTVGEFRKAQQLAMHFVPGDTFADFYERVRERGVIELIGSAYV